MCGIVGYVGGRPCRELLVAGLEKLEYRGYDSAGHLGDPDGRIDSVRAVGNLANLRAAVEQRDERGGGVAVAAPPATTGVAHTRWATHGRVTEENAHPHGDCTDRIHIVLNGIVENHAELRRELEAEGHNFSSETDAEIVAHLIERHYDGDLTAAVRAAFAELRGHYAFVAMHADQPGPLVGARKECPLVAGIGDGETFLASAIPAFLAETRHAVMIENDEMVTIEASSVTITDVDGNPVAREPEEIAWDEDTAEKGGYETFMLKEIHEQADAVAETITGRLPGDDGVDLSEVELDDDYLRDLKRIVIVACGTSYHAGPGRSLRDRGVGAGAGRNGHRLRVPLPQPGGRARGPGDRDDPVRRDRRHPGGDAAGPRAGRQGPGGDQHDGQPGDPRRRRRPLHPRRARGQRRRDQDLRRPGRRHVPDRPAPGRAARHARARAAERADRRAQAHSLEDRERPWPAVKSASARSPRPITSASSSSTWAGHIGLPVCLEGALKLKEISYIPTDAYAAGEMKHGPIALLDESTPVVCVATESPVLAKVLSNVEEVRARGAETIAIATEGDDRVTEVADLTIGVSATDWIMQPVVAILPLQLLAYEIARSRPERRPAP